MKITPIIILLAALSIYSCKKDKGMYIDPLSMEIAAEEPNFMLSSDDYTTTFSNDLIQSGEGNYTNGTIEYRVNNQVEALVEFGEATTNTNATVTKGGSKKEFELKYHKGKSKYKKVIVKPLVKSEGCNYIVEGIIKYFDAKTGAYIVTIDFGDGTCDEWAVKEWPASNKAAAGSKTFSLDFWKNKKNSKK